MSKLLFVDLKEYLDWEELIAKIEQETGQKVKFMPDVTFVEVLHNGEAKLEITLDEEKN